GVGVDGRGGHGRLLGAVADGAVDVDRGAGRALGEGDALDLHGVVAVGLDGDHVADLQGGGGRGAGAPERGRVLLAAVERDRDGLLARGRVQGDPLGGVLPGGGHLQDPGGVAALLVDGAADVAGVGGPEGGGGGGGGGPSCGAPVGG